MPLARNQTTPGNPRAGHQVYGDLKTDGLSLEWHEFSDERDGGWRWPLNSRDLLLCLNFAGTAEVPGNKKSVEPEQLAVIRAGADPLQLIRPNGPIHRFYLLTCTPTALNSLLGESRSELRPDLHPLPSPNLRRPSATPVHPFFQISPLPAPLLNLRTHLLRPPVPPSARRIWILGKIHEILAHSLFPAEPELFCERHHRINRERCARVLYLLERDMENPPSLEMLAAETHCSPFTLSRIFTQETGQSIPKALRKLRIDRAAQLLQSGTTSVTDAAMAVGYSSLGAFNKAFSNLMGCPPSKFAKLKTNHPTSPSAKKNISL